MFIASKIEVKDFLPSVIIRILLVIRKRTKKIEQEQEQEQKQKRCEFHSIRNCRVLWRVWGEMIATVPLTTTTTTTTGPLATASIMADVWSNVVKELYRTTTKHTLNNFKNSSKILSFRNNGKLELCMAMKPKEGKSEESLFIAGKLCKQIYFSQKVFAPCRSSRSGYLHKFWHLPYDSFTMCNSFLQPRAFSGKTWISQQTPAYFGKCR